MKELCKRRTYPLSSSHLVLEVDEVPICEACSHLFHEHLVNVRWIGVNDDAVDSTCDDVGLGFIQLCRSSIDVVAEVEMEAGMKWSSMKWSAVKNTSHFSAGGIGSKDKLIEDMNLLLVGKQVRRACATKSNEQNTYTVDALEAQCGVVCLTDEDGVEACMSIAYAYAMGCQHNSKKE
jgi:hypothetical protein